MKSRSNFVLAVQARDNSRSVCAGTRITLAHNVAPRYESGAKDMPPDMSDTASLGRGQSLMAVAANGWPRRYKVPLISRGAIPELREEALDASPLCVVMAGRFAENGPRPTDA